jgi:hypothetical protein
MRNSDGYNLCYTGRHGPTGNGYDPRTIHVGNNTDVYGQSEVLDERVDKGRQGGERRGCCSGTWADPHPKDGHTASTMPTGGIFNWKGLQRSPTIASSVVAVTHIILGIMVLVDLEKLFSGGYDIWSSSWTDGTADMNENNLDNGRDELQSAVNDWRNWYVGVMILSFAMAFPLAIWAFTSRRSGKYSSPILHFVPPLCSGFLLLAPFLCMTVIDSELSDDEGRDGLNLLQLAKVLNESLVMVLITQAMGFIVVVITGTAYFMYGCIMYE